MLNQPIEVFDVTDNFRFDFLNAGFTSLADAFSFDADELMKDKKFSLHTITELITLLDTQGLGRLLRE